MPVTAFADVAERLGELRRDDDQLVGLTAGQLRQHLQVLIAQQRLVGLAPRGSP